MSANTSIVPILEQTLSADRLQNTQQRMIAVIRTVCTSSIQMPTSTPYYPTLNSLIMVRLINVNGMIVRIVYTTLSDLAAQIAELFAKEQ